jgi:retinol dehydrogenase-12
MKIVSWVMFAVFARTTEAGARTLVHAVSSELPKEAHGQFLMDAQIQE